MPTRVIAGNAGHYLLYENVSADPALLISGSDNNIVVIGALAGTAGAAVVFTGAHNLFRVDQGGSVTGSGTTAIQGSDHQDLVGNNRGTISGNVLLGGGDDHFQNNFDSAVGQVFGGSGNDSLRTYEGSIALAYFGESGDDFLSGGSAGDLLDGGGDSDRLHGLGGNDQLGGGGGADFLAGGLGDDQLSGGGDEGDMALFDGFMHAFEVDISGGAGSVTDMDASDGDQGSDTISGISVLRFTDQQVDMRIPRNGLALTAAGETYVNTIDRYDYFAVELRGEGVHFVNEANIVGTAVPHTFYVEPYGYMAVSTGALALFVYNATVENRAGSSIIGFDDAIGMADPPASRSGDGLAVVNDGLIRSLEGDAIDFYGYLTVTNGSAGVIEAANRVTSRAAVNAGNSVVEIFNAGRIEGGYAINAAILRLENEGIIVGTIESSYLDSRIDNKGSITGRYEAWGGLTFLNTGQSAGDLRIDVHPVGQYYNQSYTFAALDNRGTFTGDIRITGAAQFISAPPSHADFLATIANSGTITGSIVSDPTLATPAGGGTADASFVEQVVNSGTITGDVRLGDGDDSLANSGFIAGLVDGGAGNDTIDGGARADRLQGGAGNDVVRGGGGDDVLRLHDGGDETVEGGAGNDNIFFIGALTAADLVNGGAGVDTLVVQGPYGALTLTANITQIENVSILAGSNTAFGEPGTNRHDYVLTTHDANFAAGVQARINGAALLEGEDFTFDGSAETDASYVVYGGKGKDTLLGGLGNDIFFYAEERFASGDTVNGGAGYDGMFLRGNYTI
ncbi:MAG TPA: hypothetical protein VD846_11290, partial [Allosphingosinicella sp.]|nr:hypothetical protein [Allosphingosinicella sp.]